MPINKTTALKLKASLLEHRTLSEVHSLPAFDLVQQIVHDAGLQTALIPLSRQTKGDHSRRDWELHLLVLEPSGEPSFDAETETCYAAIPLKPVTDYAGDLVEIDLSRPWWAAPNAFGRLADVLAPGWICCPQDGRASWGQQRRQAFAKGFDLHWACTEAVEPARTIDLKRTRFTTLPRQGPPLLPEPAELFITAVLES